jgi:hypothetical protein
MALIQDSVTGNWWQQVTSRSPPPPLYFLTPYTLFPHTVHSISSHRALYFLAPYTLFPHTVHSISSHRTQPRLLLPTRSTHAAYSPFVSHYVNVCDAGSQDHGSYVIAFSQWDLLMCSLRSSLKGGPCQSRSESSKLTQLPEGKEKKNSPPPSFLWSRDPRRPGVCQNRRIFRT